MRSMLIWVILFTSHRRSSQMLLPSKLSSQRKSLKRIRESFLLTKRPRKQKRLRKPRRPKKIVIRLPRKPLKRPRKGVKLRTLKSQNHLSLIEINNLK